MKYSIDKIATLTGARRYGTADAEIEFLLTDSRSLSFARESLFFAIKTDRNDGHRYIDALYARGVRNFVVQKLPVEHSGMYGDANFLLVPDTLSALQRLAERHRDEFRIPVIGITGSNGKTIVKEWLFQVLAPSMNVTRSPRSYNSQVGVPLSVWLISGRTQVAILEAGISECGEMARLESIIQPTVGVMTSLGGAHQENFASMYDKCMEKMRLFQHARTLVYPADNETVCRAIADSGFNGQFIGWSRTDEKQPFYVKSAEVSADGEAVTIAYRCRGIESSFRIPFISDMAVENSISVAATALHMGIDPKTLAERMPGLESVAMRLEVKEGNNGCTLINDYYNNDVNSLDIALDFMHRRPDCKGRRRTLVLSDIAQSGYAHEKLAAMITSRMREFGVEKFIGIGPGLCEGKDAIDAREKHFFASVDEFLGSSVMNGLHDEVILLKGARSFCFERITEHLVKKVHETILEVNLSAMVRNLNWYRSFLKPETKIVCMIKADGYGAGAVEIAKTLQDHQVDYLAVAVADEGVALRKAGITCNIMVMNPEMSSFKTLFDYRLEPEVYSFRLLDALIQAARRYGISRWPVHVKLDTGMHRLGFDPENDIEELVERLTSQTAVLPCSVFSHFVGSDADEFDAFSDRQFALFDKASKRLQEAYPHHILRHMCNSAGIEHFPQRQMDMCRLGLGLYGVDPRDNRILNNVSTLTTTILQIRRVPADETVGYSRRGVLRKDSVIGAIPIGYADGLNRHLGRGAGYCLVNGQKAPYVGNICMDVAMIDLTGIDCKEGDTVEIFGDNLPVTVLSDILDTIPYEVLTGISNRVKRVYYQD